MVMHPQVAPWGKRHFGGSHLVLIVKFGQVAEDNLSILITDVMPRASTFS
jgi:hypothetical protein